MENERRKMKFPLAIIALNFVAPKTQMSRVIGNEAWKLKKKVSRDAVRLVSHVMTAWSQKKTEEHNDSTHHSGFIFFGGLLQTFQTLYSFLSWECEGERENLNLN